jgi:RNAse (barnase) inhibitor barstar
MKAKVVHLDSTRIVDEESFHSLFQKTLGFPDFYGRNMDAWIDMMSSLDDPEPMTAVTVPEGRVLVLVIDQAEDFRKRCPDLYDDLVECSAFVNWRRVEASYEPILCLAF